MRSERIQNQRMERFAVKRDAESRVRAAQAADRFATLSGVKGRAAMRNEAVRSGYITREQTKGKSTAVVRSDIAEGRETWAQRRGFSKNVMVDTGRAIAPHLSALRAAGTSARLGGDGPLSVKAAAGGGGGSGGDSGK
jgi:hypothetical protein